MNCKSNCQRVSDQHLTNAQEPIDIVPITTLSLTDKKNTYDCDLRSPGGSTDAVLLDTVIAFVDVWNNDQRIMLYRHRILRTTRVCFIARGATSRPRSPPAGKTIVTNDVMWSVMSYVFHDVDLQYNGGCRITMRWTRPGVHIGVRSRHRSWQSNQIVVPIIMCRIFARCAAAPCYTTERFAGR